MTEDRRQRTVLVVNGLATANHVKDVNRTPKAEIPRMLTQRHEGTEGNVIEIWFELCGLV